MHPTLNWIQVQANKRQQRKRRWCLHTEICKLRQKQICGAVIVCLCIWTVSRSHESLPNEDERRVKKCCDEYLRARKFRRLFHLTQAQESVRGFFDYSPDSQHCKIYEMQTKTSSEIQRKCLFAWKLCFCFSLSCEHKSSCEPFLRFSFATFAFRV